MRLNSSRNESKPALEGLNSSRHRFSKILQAPWLGANNSQKLSDMRPLWTKDSYCPRVQKRSDVDEALANGGEEAIDEVIEGRILLSREKESPNEKV